MNHLESQTLATFTNAEIGDLPEDFTVFRAQLSESPIDDPMHAIMAKGQDIPTDLTKRVTEYRARISERTGADEDPDIASGVADPIRHFERLTVLAEDDVPEETTSGTIRITSLHATAREEVGYVTRQKVHEWLGEASLSASIDNDRGSDDPLGPDFVAVFDDRNKLQTVAIQRRVGEVDPTDDFGGTAVDVFRAESATGEQGIPEHMSEYVLSLRALYNRVSLGPDHVDEVVHDPTVKSEDLAEVVTVPPKPLDEYE